LGILVALGITFLGSVIVSAIYLGSSGAGVICLEIGFQIFFYGLMGLFLYQFVRIADQCQVQIIAYHDFLISYRQTPRSKILKKHLPSLDAVVEELSMFEQSVMTKS